MRSFTELTETQWNILEPLMPPPSPVGKCSYWRKGLNTIFLVLTTGAQWKDVPKGPQWASRSSAHRFLGNGKRMYLGKNSLPLRRVGGYVRND